MGDDIQEVSDDEIEVDGECEEPAKPERVSDRVGPEKFGFDRNNIEIDEEAKGALSREFNHDDLQENEYNEINGKPMVYAPWYLLAERLDEAFGMGNWKLLPYDSPGLDEQNNEIAWPGVLIADGTVVTSSIGSETWKSGSRMKKADAFESAKSDCLRKCCKPIMPALREIWKPSFQTEYWKEDDITDDQIKAIHALADEVEHEGNTGDDLIDWMKKKMDIESIKDLTKPKASRCIDKMKSLKSDDDSDGGNDSPDADSDSDNGGDNADDSGDSSVPTEEQKLRANLNDYDEDALETMCEENGIPTSGDKEEMVDLLVGAKLGDDE